MSYLCKYCYQRFNSKKLKVLRNCSESPTGKHSLLSVNMHNKYQLVQCEKLP